MKALELRKMIENGSAKITKIVRETVNGPHVWGRNAFEYTPIKRGFTKVKNNVMINLGDMCVVENGCEYKKRYYDRYFLAGKTRALIPNVNNEKWWYVMFYELENN